MNEEKKVPFKWEYGEETISLQLGMYANNQRLYIGMITHTEDGAEPFADMTVNLPGYSLDPGEAFISGDISKDLLRFIKENKLGKVLPYQVQSGYGKYSAVAFDLEKLKAFDPKGVAEFRKEWNLPDKKPVKKKSRGMERGMLPVKRTIKNNKFLYRQPCYGWRYFMLFLYIAHDISLVSLHAVSFEVVGCCSNLCN